jgi:hypothetical protein
MHSGSMTPADRLIDQIRAKAAELAGLRRDLAIVQGRRAAVVRFQRAVDRHAALRRHAALVRAEEQGEPFFMAAGRIDGESAHG